MPSIVDVLDVAPRIQYTASAAQTVFPYPFPIFEDDNLVVYDNDTLQVLTTDYTVSDEGDETGGNVTFTSARTAGHVITIYRDIPIERTSDFATNGPFSSASMNDELDRITLVEQQLENKIDRTVKLSPLDTSDDDDLELPNANERAGLYFAFDANGRPSMSSGTGNDSDLRTDLANGASGPGSDLIAIKRLAAEIAALITPTNYLISSSVVIDATRYGWSEANTGAENASALAAAASVWVAGSGARIKIPGGTFQLSEFVIPAGRGLIIQGEGQTVTIIDHSTGGSMVTLGANDIQLFSLRDMTLRPSATTAVILDFSGDFSAFGFRFSSLELHEGSSGNTTCIGLLIAGGTNATNHQKHYFTWWHGKIFGLGTGVKIDGSIGAAANDFRGYSLQIQGCALDGILLQDSGCNRFDASVENCGDGVTYYNYRIMGSVSSENTYIGRLENNGAKVANVPYFIDSAAGVSNYVIATMTATPAGYNTVMAPTGNILLDNGKELSHIERRERGLTRKIADATTAYLLRFMLATDTMGGIGLFGIRTDGRLSWATGTNPADWDSHLERVSVGGLQARGGVANRMSNTGNVTGAITPDLSSGWTRRMVLTGNTTINAPTNPPAGGGMVTFLFIQDGTGGWTVTFNAVFKLAGGAYTMTATANKRDVISFVYSDTDATYQEVSRSQNQS